MHHVYTLEVDWNGTLLIARGHLGDGWRRMADRTPVKLQTLAKHVGEMEDITAFELGVFLANACREFTYQWDQARLEEQRGEALFDLLPGERS